MRLISQNKTNNNMDNEYIQMFSVPMQKTVLELNIDSLIEFCYEMKRKDEKGVELSNLGGWQSDNVGDETHTEFVKLKTEIEDAANIYHREIQLKKTYNQKIDNIWVNINQKGHCNALHNHVGAVFSGVFYLTKGETSPIDFENPLKDINIHYWRKAIIGEWNSVNSVSFSLHPKPNTLLIFPSWLQHKVSMNKENTDRISFSFNTIPNEVFS